jgi:hypothetical protein
MPIRIEKIAGIPAPESILCRLNNCCPGILRLRHDCIDLGFGRNIVPEREFSGTPFRERNPRIMGDARARPKRQLQAGLQVEERDRAMFEFRADDSVRLQSKTVAIKANGALQIINADSDSTVIRGSIGMYPLIRLYVYTSFRLISV